MVPCFFLRGIHKECPYLGGGRVSNNADKTGQGEGGDLAVSGHVFSATSGRKKRTFKSHFITIFLCWRFKNKVANKK